MCASHLKLNCTFTRYRILICRGRSEKGQGISKRWDCIIIVRRERGGGGGGGGQLMNRGIPYPLPASYHTPQTLGQKERHNYFENLIMNIHQWK